MRSSPRTLALGLALFALFALFAPRASAETVAIITATAGSESAAVYLESQLDAPAVRRASPHARDLSALVAEARASFHEDLIVVLDADRAIVSVIRPADATVSSRTLDPIAARAPYAVALAAVELLELVRTAPPARAAAVAPPSRKKSLRPALTAGVLQTIGTNGDVALLQPTAGADLEVLLDGGPGWVAFGVHGAGLSPMRRGQILFFPASVERRTTLEYRRDELSVETSAGTREGHASALAWCDLGLSFVRVSVEGLDGQTVAAERHTAFWLGLGGDLRYSFGAGLGVGVGAGGAWYPMTARFFASPPGATNSVLALEEGSLELRARATLIWEIQ